MAEKFLRIFAGVFLTMLVFFGWGFAVGEYHVFPWALFQPIKDEIKEFVAGDLFEGTSLGDKLRSELFNGPDRYLAEYNEFSWEKPLRENSFNPSKLFHTQYKKIPMILTNMEEGYYLTYGIYGFPEPGFIPAAILVDTKGNVKRIWEFPLVPGKQRSPKRLILTREGKLLSNSSKVLRAKSWCGDDLWMSTEREFHHDYHDRETDVLLWGNDEIVAVDKNSGKIRKIMDMRDIVLANPSHSLLQAGLTDNFKYGEKNEDVKFDRYSIVLGQEIREVYIDDNFHQNKVASNDGLSDSFPSDALLVSFRQISLVAIIDPTTSKILWSQTFDRQHDPDWLEDGILVYNNRPHYEQSFIEKIPFEGPSEILVGDKANFRWHREATGSQQLYSDGSLLFQAHLGEAIHMNRAGHINTAIINWFDEERVTIGRDTYYITEMELLKWESQCI